MDQLFYIYIASLKYEITFLTSYKYELGYGLKHQQKQDLIQLFRKQNQRKLAHSAMNQYFH
jgi:hypothetical protein